MLKPNILFIFDDQHRYAALGSSGNRVIQTPNLDHLAGQGLVLDQAFSCCPICSPYRGQFLTGRYSHKNGVIDNEYKMHTDQISLPQALQRAGYHTGLVGKWHLGYPPYTENRRYGFDYMAAYNCNHDYYQVAYFENQGGPIKINGWAPEEETALAIRFLEEHQQKERGTPFFLALSWGPPHWPYDRYPQEFNIYDPAAVEVPPNVPEQMVAFARQEIAHYYGNITALDAQMGRIMDALGRLGLAEDTILIFTSDHGDHLSSHGYGKPMDRWMHHSFRASKATPYEESIHVPFIVRWPGRVPSGSRTQALFGSVDLMPTLLSLGDIQIPEGVQGKDLSHVFLAQEGALADSVYLQILGPGWPHRGQWVGFWRGVRSQRWVYARWKDNEYGPLLFDRENDPYEMNNLAGKVAYAGIQQRLEKRLRQWIDETEDPFDTGQRDPETGILLLGQEFTHEKYERR